MHVGAKVVEGAPLSAKQAPAMARRLTAAASFQRPLFLSSSCC